MGGVDAGDQDSGLRLAEVVAAFSLATDLGLGQPMEHVQRSWLIAVRLGERLGLEAQARVALYYVMMLAWSGCVADSAEVAAWFGDDIAFRSDSYRVDLAGLPLMGLALSHAGAGTPFLHRLRLAANLVLTGGRAVEQGLMSHCLTTTQMAGRLGLTAEVCDPLRQVFTRWDAKGVPDGVGGEDVARLVRLFHLADVVEVFHRAGGAEAAVEVAQARRGTQFDPGLVDLFCAAAREVLADLDAMAELEALIEAEPGLRRQLSERELDAALEAMADFTDLRSSFRAGHSRGVARPGRPSGPAVRTARPGDRDPAPCRPGARHRHARGTGLGPQQARTPDRRRIGADALALLLDRTGPGPAASPGLDRCDRVAGQRAPGRVRLPPGPVRGRDPGRRPHPRRRRRLPRDD